LKRFHVVRSVVVAEERDRQGRQAVLQVIRDTERPLAVAEVAERVGLHVNTVRGHLELLVHLGVVTRETEHRGGRGRPRVLYQLAAEEPRQQDAYKTLAAALANELTILGGTDQRTADEAGLLWAQALVEEGRLRPTASSEEAVNQVTTLFSELGFDATTEPLADRIYLRACPYSAIREAFPGVCEIHLGLMRGSLAVTGSGLAVHGFDIDAKPGLCVAHLGPDQTTATMHTETKELR
jgi:predicted ArsR family transcriptional regulator